VTGIRATRTQDGYEAVALVAVGIVAGIAYSGFLLDLVLPAGDPDVSVVVSSLEVEGPFGGILRTLDVVSGVLTLALVPYVWWALPRGRLRHVAVWSLAAFAVGGAMTGIIHLPCGSDAPGCPSGTAQELQALAHDGLSIVSTVAFFVSAGATALAVRRTGPRWLVAAGWASVIAGALTGVVFTAAQALGMAATLGVSQRLQILAVTAWVVCLGVFAATSGVRARRRAHAVAPAGRVRRSPG
jgi:hypothetical protein